MAQGTYYFDAATFSGATAVYTNADLSVCAPDGFYSDGVISRQQVNCRLLEAQTCPNCASNPTPQPLVFTCAISGFSVAPGIVGDAVVGSVVNGTISGSISPSTYQLGTNAYTVSVIAPLPYTNAGATIGPCSANAVGTSPVVPPGPTLYYYFLRGCQNNAGVTPTSGYMNFTSEPTNSQRYLDGASGNYYFYDNTQPILTSTTNLLPNSVNALPGEFGCPPITSGYILRRCSDSENNFYVSTTDSLSPNQRMVDNSSVYYVIDGSYSGGGEIEIPSATVVSGETGCPSIPPAAQNFECSDAGLTISDGVVGDPVDAQVANGTIVPGSISPSTYQAGSNTYSLNIEVTATTIERGGVDVPVANTGSAIPCSGDATGEAVTPILSMTPGSFNIERGSADNRLLFITANGPWAITFSGGGGQASSYFSVGQSSGIGNAQVPLYYNGGTNGWTNPGIVQLRVGNASGTVAATTTITLSAEEIIGGGI